MAKPSKEALEIQKEFLPYGAEIANLAHKLRSIGAWQTARALQKAGECFHLDVEQIIIERKRSKK